MTGEKGPEKLAVGEDCRQTLSVWLSERDTSLAGLASVLEQTRPDKLASPEDQIKFMRDMAEIHGKRTIIDELLSEMEHDQ